MNSDIWGQAIRDYYEGKGAEDITTYMYSPTADARLKDTLSVAWLFRSFKFMPRLEQQALKACRGRVLDVGCGAGSHSLYLQDQGLEVTALDRSPGAVATCRLRGLRKVIQADLFQFEGFQFDTLLLLMNGTGIAGSLNAFPLYLKQLKRLMRQGGQILIDSTDIVYLFEEGEVLLQGKDAGYRYYGEVQFKMAYAGGESPWFPWLYLDATSLQREAAALGLQCEILGVGDCYNYLARLF